MGTDGNMLKMILELIPHLQRHSTQESRPVYYSSLVHPDFSMAIVMSTHPILKSMVRKPAI